MSAERLETICKANKNDTNDAEACAEAVTRPTIRFVRVKSEFQQELSQLHCARERLVGNRTAIVNELRSFLMEFGIVLPQGRKKFAGGVQEVLLDSNSQLPDLCKRTAYRLLDELSKLEEEVSYYEKQLEDIHKVHPSCQQR